MFRAIITIVLTLTFLIGTGCVSSTYSSDSQTAKEPPSDAQALAIALARADRPEKDRERDAARKPDQVLMFFGIQRGMKVLDLYSGGGYYSEMSSGLVGPQGLVHAHNNQAYLDYAKDEITERYANDRLPNVQRLQAENNELELSPGTYDAVLLILAYHDIYFVDEKNGWPRIDRDKLLAEIYSALKPGAVFGVIDHAAVAGSPQEVGGTLHRIDPQRALEEITAAGFVLEAQSDILANPDDDHDKPMFDPDVRGKTDRFVFRFRRP